MVHTEEINNFIEAQLESWPLARANFERLRECRRHPISWGRLEGGVQLNPARIVSTGASVDSKSIAARKCFLCKCNRPEEQMEFPWLDGWDMLLNPFPILPVHFTIASKEHVPQDRVPLEMAAMAEKAPSLVFFFNGAKAGASAPDHQHVQAVLKSELPLMRYVEKAHPINHTGLKSSTEFEDSELLPFQFISGVISPDSEGMRALAAIPHLYGENGDSSEADPGLVNAFFWISDQGLLRVVVVPRRRHRPDCYFLPEGERLMISPGAIDMAGLIITPREEDFERADKHKISDIYAQTAFKQTLPSRIQRILTSL